MTRKARTTFSVEFKREAVALLEQGNKDAAQLARELEVGQDAIVAIFRCLTAEAVEVVIAVVSDISVGVCDAGAITDVVVAVAGYLAGGIGVGDWFQAVQVIEAVDCSLRYATGGDDGEAGAVAHIVIAVVQLVAIGVDVLPATLQTHNTVTF